MSDFARLVRSRLGHEGMLEVTPSGREVLRYDGFTVWPDEATRKPVAARVVPRVGLEFSTVPADGVLCWGARPYREAGGGRRRHP